MPFDASPQPTPAETANPVADALRRGRALIANPRHWCQNSGDSKTTFCAAIALRRAVSLGANYRNSVWHAAVRVLDEAIPATDDTISVVEYNDHPSTTHADILALFDRAIQAAETRT